MVDGALQQDPSEGIVIASLRPVIAVLRGTGMSLRQIAAELKAHTIRTAAVTLADAA